MDAILFYSNSGEKDPETRRQVRYSLLPPTSQSEKSTTDHRRSAAAQHSHRIGPRKPKASRKPKHESSSSTPQHSHQKRRSLQKAGVVLAVPTPGTATEGADRNATTAPVSSGNSLHGQQKEDGDSRFTSQVTVDDLPDREMELKRQAAQARWEHVQSIHQRQLDPPHGLPPTQQLPAPDVDMPSHTPLLPPILPANVSHVPASPPLTVERIVEKKLEGEAVRTRTNSQSSSHSSSTRLPQYSWTEYPRYGLGQAGLQMLANVATAERHGAPPQSSPPAPTSAPIPHDAPGFRQYEGAERHPTDRPTSYGREPFSPSMQGIVETPRSSLDRGRIYDLRTENSRFSSG